MPLTSSGLLSLRLTQDFIKISTTIGRSLMNDPQNVSMYWDRNASSWSMGIRQGHDQINEYFGVPCFLEQLGNIRNLDVLDGGCGEGRCSRHLAARGAKVTGVDISPGMIAEAVHKESQAPQGIRYEVCSCSDLKRFPDECFQLVVSYMTLMDTPGLSDVIREFARVLQPSGKLMIAVKHPCFFTPGFSVYNNAQQERAGLTVSHYFINQPYLEKWKFQKQQEEAFTLIRYPYTITEYIGAILGNGLRLISVVEPRPTEEMCRKLPALSFWRQHAALFLFIEAVKI